MTQHSPDPFEFSFSPFEADTCIAEDVIHNGKLLPFNTHHHPNIRRCESEGGGGSSSKRSGNHTAECHKLRRAVSEPNGGPKRGPPFNPLKAKVRPRWYWFAFWSTARAPAEMEMRDIKSRFRNGRRRRRQLTEYLTESNGTWRVVRSLSCNCKGADSTAVVSVTAPRRRELMHCEEG